MKKLRVTVEGKAYDVTVEMLDEGSSASSHDVASPPQAASAATQASQATSGTGLAVESPLAGKIVSIGVNVGQTVHEGEELITMEAMKMNTHVFAPHDGIIGKILVGEGDAVEEGQPLIEMSQ